MPEYGPSAIRGIFKIVNAVEPAVRDGGIVGDQKHGTGYHRSRNALIKAGKRSDYSIQDARDKKGDGDAASAGDLTMNDVLMRKLTGRLYAATMAGDPRLKGKLREFGGTLDGRNVCAFRVEDKKRILFDRTHLWHIHNSIFREFANDPEVCQGIAHVLLGISALPYSWDGKSFPGADKFYIGAEGPWITHLGERLVVHGWSGYTSGPGPTFTEVDKAAVKWFQEKQTDWDPADADGIPGPMTWARLEDNPIFQPPPSHPELYPAPSSYQVYLEKLVPGQTNSDSVWYIQQALRKLGFDVNLTGAYDSKTILAVKRYQESLRDDNPDGILGPLQTAKILADANTGARIVKDGPENVPTPPPVSKPTIKVASWNMFVDNSVTNMKKGLASLIKAGCDVICVQELSVDSKQNAVENYMNEQGYGATTRNSAVPVYWNKATQELVQVTYRLVIPGGEPWEKAANGGSKSIMKILTIVELKDKATGKHHFALNHHVIPSIEKGGKLNAAMPIRLKNYRKQRDAMCEEFLSRGKAGALVTGYGDMNLDWATDAGQDFEDALDKVGATVVWDEFPDLATHGKRIIDWIIARNGTFTSVKTAGKWGSDHEQVIAEVTID